MSFPTVLAGLNMVLLPLDVVHGVESNLLLFTQAFAESMHWMQNFMEGFKLGV